MVAQWWGMLQWDADANHFVEGGQRWNASNADPLYANVMGSQSTVVDGRVYFTSNYPAYRATATVDALSKLPETFESWTCLQPGTTVADGKVVRDPVSGALVYKWTPQTGT